MFVPRYLLDMAIMYYFCRYFSVRLGSILVAVSTLIQSLLLGSLFLKWLYKSAEFSNSLEDWSSTKKLIYVSQLVMSVQQNTTVYLKSSILFLMIHIGTCLLLIYAAIKCRAPLAWPFLAVEWLRLGALCFALVTAMALVKENILDLGALIAVTLSGGFALLFLYYKWFCVLSLCQCIGELESARRQQDSRSGSTAMKSAVVNYLASDFKHLTRRLAHSKSKPVKHRSGPA